MEFGKMLISLGAIRRSNFGESQITAIATNGDTLVLTTRSNKVIFTSEDGLLTGRVVRSLHTIGDDRLALIDDFVGFLIASSEIIEREFNQPCVVSTATLVGDDTMIVNINDGRFQVVGSGISSGAYAVRVNERDLDNPLNSIDELLEHEELIGLLKLPETYKSGNTVVPEALYAVYKLSYTNSVVYELRNEQSETENLAETNHSDTFYRIGESEFELLNEKYHESLILK